MTTLSEILTHDDLKLYPAIMAERPSGKTSSRYSFIPTTRIIEQFEASGFYPVKIQEARASEERLGFQKHLVRFRQPAAAPIGLDQLFPEIVLVNSHDAGAAFHLMAGIYRMVCTNGMVVGETLGGSVRINHIGYTDQAVREAVDMMGQRLPRVMDRVEEFKALEMTPDDAGVYGIYALGAKYGVDVMKQRDFDPYALMRPARKADETPRLWSVYNTVQEKLVEKGTVIERRETKRSYWDRNTRTWSKSKMSATRPVNAPTENVRVNQKLWELTEDFDRRIKREGHIPEGEVGRMMDYFKKERGEFKAAQKAAA